MRRRPLCFLASSFGSHSISNPYLERSAAPCRLGRQLSRYYRTSGVEDGALDGTERLERASVSPSISCSDIYGQSLKEKGGYLLEFGARRELIGLRLSCEVARHIMQEEPDTLVRGTVDGRCWPVYWWLDSTFFFAWVSTHTHRRTHIDRDCGWEWAGASHRSAQNLSLKKDSWVTCAAHCSQELTGCRHNAASGPQTWDAWPAQLCSSKVELHSSLWWRCCSGLSKC